jgi:hypothetical protein
MDISNYKATKNKKKINANKPEVKKITIANVTQMIGGISY